MNFIKQIIGLSLLLISFPVLSYESGAWTEVKQIYSKNDGSIFVYFGSDSMPGCYNNYGGYLNGSNIDKLYSTVLAAFMAGKAVRPLYQYDNTTEGYTGWGLCYVEAVYVR